MAYVSAQLNQAVPSIGDAPAIWTYYGTDVHTDIDASDFFSDGSAKGMKVNDFLFAVKTSATVGGTLHTVTVVTAGGAATVSPAILA